MPFKEILARGQGVNAFTLVFPKSSIHSDLVQNLKEKVVFMEENKALTVRR